MKTNITDLAQSEIIDLLYKQIPRLVVGHFIAASIFVFWLYESHNSEYLFTWLSVILLILSCRLATFILYQQKSQEMEVSKKQKWKHLWLALSLASGIFYSYGFITLIPAISSEYVLINGLFVIALSSSAVIAYGFSLSALFSFFIPVVIPNLFFVLFYGGQTGLFTASVLGLYSLTAFFIVKNVNLAFRRSITLNHQYEHEMQKRKVVEQQLHEISRRDGLTGLYNRRYFDEVLSSEIGRAYRNHTPLSILLVDVDHFREFNEHYGHIAGDNLLVEVGHILAGLANRNGDVLSRYGGEEFAILLPNIDAKGAFSFAEKLQLRVQEQRIEHMASKLSYLKSVTVSIGVTTLPPLAKMDAHQLLDRADKALIEAKNQGRNRVKYFENLDFDQDRV
ncbi:GGDEF domain-containing protein [Glaciecola sp. 1036]|uniref:GGDEF domain-containing protein n=1 Tax=Alteromonadaceae TaxID=72275 RepID=UPI003D008948